MRRLPGGMPISDALYGELAIEARAGGISLSECVRRRLVRQSPGVRPFRGGYALAGAALAEQHRRWFEQERVARGLL